MSEVTASELRDQTQSLLGRVAGGERITIAVDGRPAAELRPVGPRHRWMARAEFADLVLGRQADSALAVALKDLAGDSSKDFPDA